MNERKADGAPNASDLARLRREYDKGDLSDHASGADPVELFRSWLGEALRVGAHEPNAMTLATIGEDGRPRARIVLLKSVDEHGFVFFTNYESKKGAELTANPFASLVFFWPELERQVRVEGAVTRTSAAESDEYFALRPEGAQLGAWASRQSRPIASREALEADLDLVTKRFGGGAIPRPDHWGGFRLDPHRIELWHGRPSRLHDRLLFERDGRAPWTATRLSP
ncbi:MAG: pyridoxamine 5'-phosphate oxidase [Myxococcales bacterium]|nr:pyridoxamine 5'-phosphate oxidase [Myxococcales bacterium]